ncbi:Spo0B domain-containing protein [Alicyclobacillus tolerans]|uniref:Spo0B domain-containing protein n=1 Tax=Alicyclobacillus tolerans TaxID=90970 RepID=UPI003B78F464
MQDKLSWFRGHRHEVLNKLQLIRAYMQMNRLESALEHIDQLSIWLRSLSELQNSQIPGPVIEVFAECSYLQCEFISQINEVTHLFGLDTLICTLIELNNFANQYLHKPLTIKTKKSLDTLQLFFILPMKLQYEYLEWIKEMEIKLSKLMQPLFHVQFE